MHDLASVPPRQPPDLRPGNRDLGERPGRMQRVQPEASGGAYDAANRHIELLYGLLESAGRARHVRLHALWQPAQQAQERILAAADRRGVVDVENLHGESSSSSSAACTRSAIAGHARSRARAAPARPSLDASSWSSRSRVVASATSTGSLGSTSRPGSPSTIASRAPPTLPPRAGLPNAPASR